MADRELDEVEENAFLIADVEDRLAEFRLWLISEERAVSETPTDEAIAELEEHRRNGERTEELLKRLKARQRSLVN